MEPYVVSGEAEALIGDEQVISKHARMCCSDGNDRAWLRPGTVSSGLAGVLRIARRW
jgi:hypothetical protein